MVDKTCHLNPFVYLSETDIRFYLIVLISIAVPALWALILGLVLAAVEAQLEMSVIVRLLICVPLVLFIPLVIYWQYRRHPENIIKKAGLKVLSREKFPDHTACIDRLRTSHAISLNPTLMYEPLNSSVSAHAFGTRDHIYASLDGGLISVFRTDPGRFKSIVLHEFGHMINMDVGKAYLADAAWRTMRIIVSVLTGVLVLMLLFTLPGATQVDVVKDFLLTFGIIVFLLIFLGIVYVLRNQIIRLRELYADAKVREWGSSAALLSALGSSKEGEHSPLEFLARFHPGIRERIAVLKNNLPLFRRDLWVAFSIGFSYGVIVISIPQVWQLLFTLTSAQWDMMKVAEISVTPETGTALLAVVSLFIFTFLMLAISSTFHRSVLKDFFVHHSPLFSPETLRDSVEFSLVFSLGFFVYYLIFTPTAIAVYDAGTIVSDLATSISEFLVLAAYFFVSLLFVLLFASMLIRQSFSAKAATKNFFMLSMLASLLFVVNEFYAVQTVHNRYLIIVFFLVFSGALYLFIRIGNRTLHCPYCSTKLPAQDEIGARCHHCDKALFSWAVSPDMPEGEKEEKTEGIS
jgi:hypothetical protein